MIACGFVSGGHSSGKPRSSDGSQKDLSDGQERVKKLWTKECITMNFSKNTRSRVKGKKYFQKRGYEMMNFLINIS